MQKVIFSMSQTIPQRILEFLSQSNEACTIDQITAKVSSNRITVSKYLKELEKKGLLESKEIGKAKLFEIKREKKEDFASRLEQIVEEKIAERMGKKTEEKKPESKPLDTNEINDLVLLARSVAAKALNSNSMLSAIKARKIMN
jgi:DNA-binding transcriptional ArsR family regulator